MACASGGVLKHFVERFKNKYKWMSLCTFQLSPSQYKFIRDSLSLSHTHKHMHTYIQLSQNRIVSL